MQRRVRHVSLTKAAGQPFVGSISLTTGTPGPVPIPIITQPGGAAYTLAADERIVLTNVAISSNDTAQPLVTIDDGASAPRTLVRGYTSATVPALIESMPVGAQGKAATLLRATASAVTAAKTVEVTVRGFVTKTL